MSTFPTNGLARDRDALERRLREVMPAVRLVRERRLRRVASFLAEDGEPVSFRSGLPLWIDRERLRDLLPLPDGDAGPGRVVLLVDPCDRVAATMPDADVLRAYWRLLVRAEILALGERLTPDTARAEFDALGPTAEREIRFVLDADDYVPPGADAAAVFRAFAAVVLDRVYFEPESVPLFFPSLPDVDAVRSAVELALGIGVTELAARLKPAGAADAVAVSEVEDIDPEAPVPQDADEHFAGRAAFLAHRARAAAKVGNHVRAAIFRTRAANALTGPDRDAAMAGARSAIHDGLVARLGKVLDWDYQTRRQWTRALVPLLEPASAGVWPRAARALYDLQKVPADLERDLFKIDPIEWARSLGRRPIRRPLTRARHVILLRHLMSADRHLSRVELPHAIRDALHVLLLGEIHRAEDAVRAECGPMIHRVLDEVGLVPANVAERVSRDKVVDELLDRACEKGYLRLSDLRDAVARNQLKMPDLDGPREFVDGDPLLRADERLADELDGVYHRGEIYLRWIQRLTALAFGTASGRWLTKYLLLPFGGAVMTVEFAKYLTLEVRGLGRWVGKTLSPSPPVKTPPVPDDDFADTDDIDSPPADMALPTSPAEVAGAAESVQHEAALGLRSVTAALLLGFVYLGLLHVRPFRVAVGTGLLAAGRAVRAVFVELPAALWKSPPVRAVRRHPATRFVVRHFGSALFLGGFQAGAMAFLGYDTQTVALWSGLVFAWVAAAVATPVGRDVDERAWEGIADGLRELRVNLIPGIVSALAWAFRWLAGQVERCLYAVDEWFRFRAGQSEGSLALKGLLAALWFPVAYLTRFAFYLLFEPQINPLKHFPVVTVSHKLLLPMVPGVASATGLNEGTVFMVIFCIPGIFGFIAWECKENWRLYAANRSVTVPPAVLGHHGETMRGLLQPGFHSGTVPKLYRKVRDAIRAGETSDRPAALGRWEHDLEEVQHAITATAERELVPLLRSSGCWGEAPPTVAAVRVGVQAMEVDFALPGAGGSPLRLTFENADGRVVARLVERGWAASLSPHQQGVLGVGLGGLAELFAATWEPSDAVPALTAELHARPWEHRVRYWDSCGAARGLAAGR